MDQKIEDQDYESGLNITKSVRIDEEMEKKLDKVALYEKVRAGTLLRMWVHDKIQTYYRNPQFKSWIRQLERNLIKK